MCVHYRTLYDVIVSSMTHLLRESYVWLMFGYGGGY